MGVYRHEGQACPLGELEGGQVRLRPSRRGPLMLKRDLLDFLGPFLVFAVLAALAVWQLFVTF